MNPARTGQLKGDMLITELRKEEGEINGVLPLFLMRSMIFDKKLVSVPFAPYGGGLR